MKTPKKQRPTVLLLHGFRGTSEGLEDVAKALKKQGLEVAIPDLPPFGKAGAMAEYTPETYADYVNNYIKKQKLKKPILVGHSMGSIVAAAAAAEYTQVIADKLVLLAPISARPARVFTSLAPLIAIAPSDLVTLVCTLYLKNTNDWDKFWEMLAVSCLSGRKFASRGDVRKVAKFSMKYKVGDFKFKQQTLLLAGDKDHLIKKAKTEKLATELEKRGVKCKTEFLPREGHLLNYEVPELVAQKIAEFVKS
ncbi:alpha/beta hydrolase [Candidatus Saccharibacteria bacterium]|nr:alpha/beta hydrolase [Candidatus Saccharibacteria bacterium]